MTNRHENTLREPDPSRDYTHFPQHQVPARDRWFRAHDEKYSPWWFASPDGRFNLHPPRGTLNLGSSQEVAAREYLGPVLTHSRNLPISLVSHRKVSCLEVPELSAADFTSPAASAFGIVPGDVTAPMDKGYDTTRAWAERINSSGMGGILAKSRFGAGTNPTCLFIFGNEGEHELGDLISSEGSSLREIVSSMPGYVVDPIPHSGTLVVDP